MPNADYKQHIREKYNFRPFQEAPPSKEQVEYLPLESIDLAKFDEGPEARKALADQLERALTDYGFFRLINHGISEELIETMKSISQSTFETSDEVKQKFFAGNKIAKCDEGEDLGVIRGTGYKPKGHWKYDGEGDSVEFFNVRHFNYPKIFQEIEHPEFVQAHLDDIGEYYRFLHQSIQRKVCTLIDIILELPEGEFYEKYFAVIPNSPKESGTGFGRFLLYHPVNEEYEEKTSSTWMRGHTDAGGFTFILSQPILSLQVRTHDNKEWKYVFHAPNSIIVNLGDTMKFLTSGYFKSAIHRVQTAPKDQREYYRNTIIYFATPRLDVYMDPETLDSPKLKRKGYIKDASLARVTIREFEEAKSNYFGEKAETWVTNVKILGRECVTEKS